MCAQSVRLEPFTCGGQGQDNDQQERDCIFTCKLLCCKCSFCHRVATKERRKSQLLLQSHRNKICERCFLCKSLEFCKCCHKCPNCCHKSTCRGKPTSILGEVGGSRFESKSSHNTQRGLHSSLPVQTQFNQVTNCHKQLCQPTKTVPPFGGTVSADEQKCSGTCNKPKLTGVLQPAIFGTQTQQPVETYPGPEHLEHLSNGDPRDNKASLQTGEWVTSTSKGRILPYTNSQSVQEVDAFSHPRSVLPVQSPTLWTVTAPMEFTVVAKEVKLMAIHRGIRIHQYLNDWLVIATSHQTCLQHTQTLVALCRELGRLVNKEKSELDPKQVFQLCRLPVRPQGGQGQTHTRALADLNRQDIVNPVRSASCPS